MTNQPATRTQMEEAGLDVISLGGVINGGTGETVTTRTGRVHDTLAQKLSLIRGMVWRGQWSAGTNYVVNDVAGHFGRSYIAIADSLAETPGPGPSWQLIVDQETEFLHPLPVVACSDGKLRLILVAIGQSNAKGKGAGGNVTISDLVKVWDGTQWVVAQNGVSPFDNGHNNSTLQAAHQLAVRFNVEVRIVLNVQGGLSLENWTEPLNGRAAPTIDMWNPLLADVGAALANLGASQISAVIFTQGESNDGTAVNVYYEQFEDFLENGLKAQSWWGSDARLLDVALATPNGAQNLTKQLFARQMGIRHTVIPTTDLPTTDGVHYTGASLDIIGGRAAAAIAAPPVQRLNQFFIEDNATIEVEPTGLPGLFNSIEDVTAFVQQHVVANGKKLVISLKAGVHTYTSVAMESPYGQNLIFRGATPGTMPTAASFVGTKATDETMLRGVWPTQLEVSGQGMAVMGDFAGLENFLLIGDVNADGLLLGDETGARRGGRAKVKRVGIHDFNEAGVEVKEFGQIYAGGLVGDPQIVVSYCQDGIKVINGSADVPGALITHNTRYGIYCDYRGAAKVDNADIVNNGTNDLFVASAVDAVISAKSQLAATTTNRAYNSPGAYNQTIYGAGSR